MPEVRVSLSTLRNGALERRFQEALDEVLNNLRDPNTAAKDTRKIVITMTFRGQEDRQGVFMSAEVSTKNAPAKALQAFCNCTQMQGELQLWENQAPKSEPQKELEGVSPFPTKQGGGDR